MLNALSNATEYSDRQSGKNTVTQDVQKLCGKLIMNNINDN